MDEANSSIVEANPLTRALARIEAAADRIDRAARVPTASGQGQGAALKQEVGAALAQIDQLILELER